MFLQVKQVAISYNYKQSKTNLCDEYCNCYITLPESQQHCRAEVYHYSFFPRTVFKNDLNCFEVVRSITGINERHSYLVKRFFGTSEYRVALKCNPMTQIHGLKYRSNRTVNFVLFDYYLHASIARSLGISEKLKSGLVVVDVRNEDEYIMKEELSSQNIGLIHFCFNFHRGRAFI